MTIATDRLVRQKDRIHTELYNRVLPFWLKNSLDREFGGYFNCLDRDGSVYDTKKHIWLQGREVWMMSKIHNRHFGQGEPSPYLEAAELGAKFLRTKARQGDRVFFSLTREGNPHFLQRKMFSECFYVMAMAEYARASGDASAHDEAHEMFGHVVRYSKDPSLLGRAVYKGLPATGDLAVPMILLNLIEEINEPGEERYEDIAKWCVERIDLHIRPEIKLVVESVGLDGKLIDSPEGRLINPGHAIEAGWFLMNYAAKRGDEALKAKALDMINWSYEFGWDKEHGGIYYFLDRLGYSPTQLEWNMKLWWVHVETMVAFLMAYRETGDPTYFAKFEAITDWSFDHFADKEHGEWFGYLDRFGNVTHRFKGGPYKGCFHVPRALYLCDELLAGLIGKP